MGRENMLPIILASAMIAVAAGMMVIARSAHAARWPDRVRRQIRALPERQPRNLEIS